jgi:hypothetical protein
LLGNVRYFFASIFDGLNEVEKCARQCCGAVGDGKNRANDAYSFSHWAVKGVRSEECREIQIGSSNTVACEPQQPLSVYRCRSSAWCVTVEKRWCNFGSADIVGDLCRNTNLEAGVHSSISSVALPSAPAYADPRESFDPATPRLNRKNAVLGHEITTNWSTHAKASVRRPAAELQ